MYTDANADHSVPVDAVAGELRVAVGLFFVLSGFLLARPWVAAARGERLFACGIATAVSVHGRRPGPATSAALLAGGWALVVGNGWWHSGGTGLAGHVLADLPAAA